MTSRFSRRAVLAGLAALGPAASALAQAPAAAPLLTGPTGPQVGPAPTVIKAPYPRLGKITRTDPRLDALIDASSPIEKVADGFIHAEGPVWIGGSDGYLLASDTRENAIIKWSPKGGREIWKSPAGLGGKGWMEGVAEPGTNGLIAARGGLIAADSGNRTISFIDLKTKAKKIIVPNFEGKRLNTPNDAVLAPDGSIYFDDPPYGFQNRGMSPIRDLDFSGIYRLSPDNKVTLLDKSLAPNGIALSPDGKILYSTDQTIGWIAWDLVGGKLTNRRTLIDRSSGIKGGDGMKIDNMGNLWASCGDGIAIFTAKGERLGTISTDETISNCEFGADGYLYLANTSKICRVKVKAKKIARKV